MYEFSGARYIKYLEDKGQKDSREYNLAQESIDQAKIFRILGDSSWNFRENLIVENFEREFDALNGAIVIGTYSISHFKDKPMLQHCNLANRLSKMYRNAVRVLDLTQNTTTPAIVKKTDRIILLEEDYTVDCLKKELEFLRICYHKYGIRHLFLESGYATAQLLNLWMKSDNDKILNQMGKIWGNANEIKKILEFFKEIKKMCPKMVFHGTDMEQFSGIEKQYIEYLKNNGMKNSKEYELLTESILQAKEYRTQEELSWKYRENVMLQNFRREFDSLSGTSIMGIYGWKHVNTSCSYKGNYMNMTDQLAKIYGDAVHRKDVSK